MSTRTRRTTAPREDERDYFDIDDDRLALDNLSEEELEALLFDEEAEESTMKGLFNLPTMAGLSMIVVGIAYIFQQLGLFGGASLNNLVAMLPWLAGILIILLGFGVLSWRPQKKKKKRARKAVEVPTGTEKVVVEAPAAPKGKKKRLRKSRNKKIAGVAGGIGEYFNIDPTLVRIAFVIATIATNGGFIFGYLLLSFIMSKPEPRAEEERITIIKDS